MDNTARNSYVKRRLTSALLDMLREGDWRGITVSALCERAEVSRNSFYRNYSGKEDILRGYILELNAEWERAAGDTSQLSDEEKLAGLFGYFNYYRDFYSLLYSRGLLGVVKGILYEVMGPKPEHDNKLAYSRLPQLRDIRLDRGVVRQGNDRIRRRNGGAAEKPYRMNKSRPDFPGGICVCAINSSRRGVRSRPGDGRTRGIQPGRWRRRGRGRSCGRPIPARLCGRSTWPPQCS